MTALESGLRKNLERAVVKARDIAEDGARAALQTLAVSQPDAYSTMTKEQRDLRTALRAKAKNLGEGERGQGIAPLVEEIAYEQWHRLLFARFLAENRLLMHPLGGHLSIEECAELAPSEGADNGWDLAGRYAALMLPGIFRAGDPAAQVRLAREYRSQLEGLVEGLPEEVFTAEDGLGWTYQFWQAKRKDEVNKAGHKIGARELAPVTQLFTEDYMVRFLLENSLGAWWAARHPDSPLLREMAYLRFADDGAPAAGAFPGWPERAAEVTVMDPCCGSGHFLARAFHLLRRMRMEEEALDAAAAGDAVLRDNVFGLELDERCVQIASFALALEAWKSGGYREIPMPQVACSGVPVGGQLEEWLSLAGTDENLRQTLADLHRLFRDASRLGSLIDPQRVVRDRGLFAPDWHAVKSRLSSVPLPGEELRVSVLAAQETARAVDFLSNAYTLVSTNVPYLSRGKQDDVIRDFGVKNHERSKGDLATMLLERCLAFCHEAGTVTVVLPTNWMYLITYATLRRALLKSERIDCIALLGPSAFEDMNWWAIRTGLFILSRAPTSLDHRFAGVELGNHRVFSEKPQLLATTPIHHISQASQKQNPEDRIVLAELATGRLLSDFARTFQGMKTGDDPRYRRQFWEAALEDRTWEFMQGSVSKTMSFGGMEDIVRWEQGTGDLARSAQARIQGQSAWRHRGVAVSQMGGLATSLYIGDAFDSNISPIIPDDTAHLPALWAYCSSSEYVDAVRLIEPGQKVNNASLLKVPFDLERWQDAAIQAGPLQEPHSDDPTQWLFKGHPKDSTAPLQVAVARLLGYCWPEQPETDGVERHADADGLVPLVPVRGETPAAERLRALLAEAFGEEWSGAIQERLLAEAGFAGRDLGAWLADRKGFFAQHVKLFHNRPFVWHITDGARDGFSVLVNYHKLTPAALDRLIYTYLGDWIARQEQARAAGEAPAEDRLLKARELKAKLEAIRDGEPPYDVYVRWKPLHEQPIGWDPDLNDGVRLNIRPFVKAGVLRAKVSVNWNKDRGDNPPGSTARQYAAEAQQAAVNRKDLSSTDGRERLNDLHLTRKTKQNARDRAKTQVEA